MPSANRLRGISNAAGSGLALGRGAQGTGDPIRFTVPRSYIDTRSGRMGHKNIKDKVRLRPPGLFSTLF